MDLLRLFKRHRLLHEQLEELRERAAEHESELAAVRDDHLQERESLRTALEEATRQHKDSLAAIEKRFDAERALLREMIDHLKAELVAESEERAYLQDRVFQKYGAAPIYAPSPGEAARIVASSGEPKPTGARAVAIAAGRDSRRGTFSQVRNEVDEYLKGQKGEGQPSQPTESN
jgi:chromosome segregation ATPase